jgi:hypothetical protein
MGVEASWFPAAQNKASVRGVSGVQGSLRDKRKGLWSAKAFDKGFKVGGHVPVNHCSVADEPRSAQSRVSDPTFGNRSSDDSQLIRTGRNAEALVARHST